MTRTDQPVTIHRHDYVPPAYAMRQVDLRVRLKPDATEVTAMLALARQEGAEPGPLTLHGEDLELLGLAVDGKTLSQEAYRVDNEGLTLLDPPKAFKLTTKVRINPEANTRLEGLYRSGGIYVTQCEAEGFRRITYALDRPDVLARYRVMLEAEKASCPVLLSNGNLVKEEDLPDGWHRAVWEDPFPKPSYLFALVAGKLDVLRDRTATASGRRVHLAIWAAPGQSQRCAFAMRSLKKAMAWDEQAYGLEYDLDVFNIVAVPDFNMGAMENKSLNVFNAKYVMADPSTATDADYAWIEGIVGHEYFHNWTGNRVTCRDWFQLSLKEGLTVFRDQQFSAAMGSPAVKRVRDVKALRSRQFAEDAGPLAHPVRPESYIEINNFYTATVYEKGAEVVRMLHTLLGPAGFRKGMDLYVKRHDGKAATVDEFLGAMGDANGADLVAFSRWYGQAGTPRITVQTSYEADIEALHMKLTQSTPATPGQPDKVPLVIPLRVGFLGSDGAVQPVLCRDPAVRTMGAAEDGLIVLEDSALELTFQGLEAEPIISLNRGFSAPVLIEHDEPAEALAVRMAHDPDPFNRWDAGQKLVTRTMLDMVAGARTGDLAALSEAMGVLLTKAARPGADRALLAEMLLLPSAAYLADQMSTVDVDGILRARADVRHRLAEDHAPVLRRLHESMAPPDDDRSQEAHAVARRALRNAALGLLCGMADEEDLTLASVQAAGKGTMTARMGGLAALNETDHALRDEALATFMADFAADANVLDKALALYASGPAHRAAADIQRLLAHPAVSLSNPNKVRALYGTFAMANLGGFHAEDGAGYALITDAVRTLDGRNPQVAARLVSAFSAWKRFPPPRRGLMEQALREIAAIKGLSRDSFEIASKALEG